MVPVALFDEFKHGFAFCFDVFSADFTLMIHYYLHSYLREDAESRLRLI